MLILYGLINIVYEISTREKWKSSLPKSGMGLINRMLFKNTHYEIIYLFY